MNNLFFIKDKRLNKRREFFFSKCFYLFIYLFLNQYKVIDYVVVLHGKKT